MTKRKLLAIIIALVIISTIYARGAMPVEATDSKQTTEEATDSKQTTEEVFSAKFILLEVGRVGEVNLYQYIMYDPDTLVMYTYMGSLHGGGFSVMYNADGTPKLYYPE